MHLFLHRLKSKSLLTKNPLMMMINLCLYVRELLWRKSKQTNLSLPLHLGNGVTFPCLAEVEHLSSPSLLETCHVFYTNIKLPSAELLTHLQPGLNYPPGLPAWGFMPSLPRKPAFKELSLWLTVDHLIQHHICQVQHWSRNIQSDSSQPWKIRCN